MTAEEVDKDLAVNYILRSSGIIERAEKEVGMSMVYRPGEPAPVSGEFEVVGPRGGDTGKERTAVQGPKPCRPRRNPAKAM